jgi:hypothetical protein
MREAVADAAGNLAIIGMPHQRCQIGRLPATQNEAFATQLH